MSSSKKSPHSPIPPGEQLPRVTDSQSPKLRRLLFLEAPMFPNVVTTTIKVYPRRGRSNDPGHIYCQGGSVVKNLPAMQETQVQSLGQEVPQEKEMATHSSIIAWRIPWTEEPSGLLFMGLQRVRDDRVTNTFTFSPGLVLGVRNDESHSQRQFYKQIMPRGSQALYSRPLLQK